MKHLFIVDLYFKRYIFFIFFLISGLLSQAQQVVLNLQDCRNLAIENNKQLKISQAYLKKAKEEKKAAFTQYLPDISFTGAYLYNQKNLSLLGEDKFLPIGTLMPDGSFGFTPEQIHNGWTLINGNPTPLDANGNPFNPASEPDKILWKQYTTIPKKEFELDIRNVFTGSVSLIQPLFMGGKIAAYNKITQYTEDLANTMHDTGLQEVIIQTDQAYWQTVSLENKRKLSENYVALLRQMDHDVQAMIAEGVATRADGLSVKVKLNEAEMILTQVEDGLQLSKMQVCRLCGLPLDETIVLADEKEESFPVNEYTATANVNEAFAKRPELKSLNLATKIFEKKEAIVLSDMLPSLALTGNYLVTNPNSFNGFQNKFAGSWHVGLLLNMPVFHWGEKQHKLQAAKAETRIKQLEFDEAKEKIELQVNQASFKLKEAQKKLIASDRNKESAEENLRYAKFGFQEGLIPALNIMEAQTAWYKAQSEYIDARIAVRLGQTELEKALGIMNYQ
ncbi:MAG: TolC family protein [Dysgonamonadaceae bacterium]|jgi:outer membrane protein TolC|nr:TolC family protein [Dysgonamonadaceae bacterium]